MPWTLLIAALLASSLATAALADTFSRTSISDAVSMLAGGGGNIAISQGPDGLLVVDDDLAENAAELEAYLDELGQVQYLLNTHWHYDHTGANVTLGDAVIIAHDNVRKRLSTRQEMPAFNRVVEALDDAGLPDVTFQQDVSLYFNGDKITLIHLPNGHTDGDSAVLFARDNILHLGDHYFNGRFPFVDLGSGGNAVQLAANVRSVLANIDDKTVVIPGHGALSNRAELLAYSVMLDDSIAQVKAMKAAGKSLEQAQLEGLELSGDNWDSGFIKQATWISFIYHSL